MEFDNPEINLSDTIAEVRTRRNVSLACATDIIYLRTRQRWTPQLEDELIRLHAEGKAPNMCEFGVTPQTQAAFNAAAEQFEIENALWIEAFKSCSVAKEQSLD